jgi:PAS domain S-box-containing protein
MENYPKQSPIDREINVNPSSILMCKINADGIIEYVNHSFSEISGYEEYEIIGESMDVLRHPDVPQVIYDVLKERLDKHEPIRIISKQLAKDGRYFWLASDYETKVNDAGELVAHYSHSVAAPSYAVHKINSLYKILSNIEAKSGNTETSKRYLIGFLEERNLNYNQFIEELSVNHPEYEKPFQQQIEQPRQQPKQQKVVQRNILKEDNRSLHLNNINYNGNLDISSSNNIEIPLQNKRTTPVKKKSLLKKVFGK